MFGDLIGTYPCKWRAIKAPPRQPAAGSPIWYLRRHWYHPSSHTLWCCANFSALQSPAASPLLSTHFLLTHGHLSSCLRLSFLATYNDGLFLHYTAFTAPTPVFSPPHSPPLFNTALTLSRTPPPPFFCSLPPASAPDLGVEMLPAVAFMAKRPT